LNRGFIIVENFRVYNEMMSQQTERVTLPTDLDSPRAKLVYLYLRTHGEATLDELQNGLGMQKLTLYSILGTLTERDLVDGDAERYAAR
jgi:hypothetical protein